MPWKSRFIPVPPGYYQSVHWRGTDGKGGKKWAALKFWNFTCQACGEHHGEKFYWKLDVHHTPEAYAQLGHEDVRNLLPLCGKNSGHICHKKGRYTKDEIKRDRRATWWIRLTDWIFSYLSGLFVGIVKALWRFACNSTKRILRLLSGSKS